MDTTIELSETEKAKIRQNEQEELLFRKNLHSLINGDRKLASKPLVIGKTPYSLAICGANSNLLLTINKKVINKALRPEVRDENGKLVGKTGHGLSEDNIIQALNEIKNPAMIFKGSHDNSLLVITNIKDINNRNIVVAVELNKKEGFETVNQILSPYGRDNLSEYIEKNIDNGNLIAINKEKANEMLHSIEKWYLKENTLISFNNSIAYSTANVKYISENSQNISEKEKFPSGDERSDNMAETTQQELLERIAALEKQVSAMTAEQQNLKEQINTVNQFISSITESQNFEQSMSTIESMGKQVLDCGKAEFWCYDGAENKYFTNDENRGGRDWQIAKENMRIAAETKEAHIAGGEAYIPIISNDKVAGILVASEKDGAFDRTSLEKFAPNGQIANTIDLSLKKEFEHQGRITDELTRLKNRQGAKEYAANTMAHNVNAEKDMCLIMCDIDHFKSINDTYGHDAGDTVLKNVAGILQSGTRQGADSAFRWGGEEMVCVLNCDYDHAMDIAERLRQQIESAMHLVYNAEKQPVNVSVTISMGVYQVKPDKEIAQENAFNFFEEQLKFADALAYEAKGTGRNKVVGENDIMQEKNAEKENYSIFLIDNGIEKKYFHDDNTDVNALVQRLADGNLTYPEISKNCTEISDLGFAEFEQSEKNPPVFCAEIDLSTKDIVGDEKPMELTVWNNDKTATISLGEAIQSIKENGTVNLEYQKFAENNDTVELASEYLDAAQHLNDVYDDFMYHKDIFNNEHIEFVNKHGQLPYDLNSPENRAVVSEYINTQLDGGNITETQRESLKNLQQEIRDFEEPLFVQEVEKISEWCEEAQEKAAERLEERDSQNYER
ncbi:MAG: diguanylate cyclase [Oscillospiraceae bacterium]|nr:diguanylate cyclase [Oscillospiraceae bacterium]